MFTLRSLRLLSLGGGLLMAAALCAAPVCAPAADSAASPGAADAVSSTCFMRRNWNGAWKVTPDARTLYIKVSEATYRLDLQSAYPLLRDPWAVLHNAGPTDSICSPLDFRFTVSDQIGNLQSPIVSRITRLTPAQAAALPKKLRP